MVWLAATQSAEPMRARVVGAAEGDPIMISLQGIPAGLAAFDVQPATATVVVRGVPDDIDALDASDIRVTADLSAGVDGGDVITVPLHAECVGCGRSAVRIVSVSPAEVQARVERSAEKRVPVLIEGADAAEACRGAAATFEPATVMVTGASSRVDAVHHASVADPSTGASGSRVELDSVPVQAVTDSGDAVSNVTIEPDTVQAVVEVIQLETCAQVAVLPVYNDPPAGYYVAGIEVDPDHIQLRGDPARLAAFREESVVLTGLIDISNSRSTVETLAQLDLPADVEPVDAAEGVTVTILVSPFPGTRLIEVPVDAIGIPTGLAVDGLSPSRIQVLVSGPLPELDNLDVTALRGTVDVTGLEAGTHRLRPGLDLPSGLRVRSIAPAEVDVRLVAGQPDTG